MELRMVHLNSKLILNGGKKRGRFKKDEEKK
jgi:hypothetical protein